MCWLNEIPILAHVERSPSWTIRCTREIEVAHQNYQMQSRTRFIGRNNGRFSMVIEWPSQVIYNFIVLREYSSCLDWVLEKNDLEHDAILVIRFLSIGLCFPTKNYNTIKILFEPMNNSEKYMELCSVLFQISWAMFGKLRLKQNGQADMFCVSLYTLFLF